MTDTFDLSRFQAAQDPLYDQVRRELAAGAKRSHWMWFVFPQLAGLGMSPMARRYALASRDEAQAYLQHAVLGARLLECTALVLAVQGRTANDIFGSPDDIKFRSCMTLFAEVGDPSGAFRDALRRYFDGKPDGRTLALLNAGPAARIP
jgi:uncharacterized protein (DUF1810 family)